MYDFIIYYLFYYIVVAYTQSQCSQNVRQSVYSYLSLFLLCLKYNPVKVKDSDIELIMNRIMLGLSDSNSNIVINSIECLNSCLLLFSDNNSILIKTYPSIINSLLEHTQKISFF